MTTWLKELLAARTEEEMSLQISDAAIKPLK